RRTDTSWGSTRNAHPRRGSSDGLVGGEGGIRTLAPLEIQQFRACPVGHDLAASARGTEGSNPCTLQGGYWLVGIVDWPDRAGLPGVALESPCFEHLEGTCAPAGRPRRKSRGRLRFE